MHAGIVSSHRRRITHWISAGLVCVALAGWVNAAAAGSSVGAPLAVGVTVARSCSVRTEPVDSSSSLVHLGCAAGATASGVLLGNSVNATPVPAGGHSFAVHTERVPEDGTLRVLAVNF